MFFQHSSFDKVSYGISTWPIETQKEINKKKALNFLMGRRLHKSNGSYMKDLLFLSPKSNGSYIKDLLFMSMLVIELVTCHM